MKNTKSKTQFLTLSSGDDSGPIFEALPGILAAFGLFVYDDPVHEGSSTYGVIISNKKLTKKEILEKCVANTGMSLEEFNGE